MNNANVCCLQDDTRDLLKAELCNIQLEGARDIEGYDLYEGFSRVGYNNMTDVELVQEFAQCVWEWTDLMKKCLSELGADALLKNIPVPNIDTSELVEENEERDLQLKALCQLRSQFTEASDQYAEITLHIDKRRSELAKKSVSFSEFVFATVGDGLQEICDGSRFCTCDVKDLASVGCKCGGC